MLRCEPELAGCLRRLGCVRAACWTPPLLLACLARDGARCIALFSPVLGLQLAPASREPTPVCPVLWEIKVLHPLHNILGTPNRLHLRSATLLILLNLSILPLRVGSVVVRVGGCSSGEQSGSGSGACSAPRGSRPAREGTGVTGESWGAPGLHEPTHKAPQLLQLGLATGWHLSTGRLVCFNPSRGAAESSGHGFGCSPAFLPV